MAVQIPQILIHPAADEPVSVEPPTPFASIEFDSGSDEFRPHYLSPPPTTSPRFFRQQSPLAPASAARKANGIERAQFEALLRATREKNNVARKPQDLRKEVAIKAHKSKQLERRALFLSKIAQPPSPSAACTPKTPPESPSIFHYSLPSPGLESPIAHYESLVADPDHPSERKGWIEQVDFRLPGKKANSTSRISRTPCALPSLDEISARLNAHREAAAFASVPTITIDAPEPVREHKNRLPAFLLSSKPTIPRVSSDPVTKPRLPIGNVGRLSMPARQMVTPRPEPLELPKSVPVPKLEVTTLVVPCSTTSSPARLSETNLQALDSRERRSADMLSRLRRRATLTTAQSAELTTKFNEGYQIDTVQSRSVKWKRHSAPAVLSPKLDKSHPVLSMPGGF